MSELLALDPCPHPTLVSWEEGLRREVYFQCVECRKKIAIPKLNLVHGHTAGDMQKIVLLSFGREIPVE